MKKSHLALSLLAAFAGTAAAQSNVTLFGLIDVNVTHYTAGDNSNAAGTGKALSRTAMEDGTTNGLNGSRWGIRTVEDLGGGWSAGAWLESGFDVSQGTSNQGGRLFGRQAFLFVNSNTLGSLRLGRQYVLADEIIPNGNPYRNALTFNPTTNVVNNGRNVATMLDAPRADNVVRYRTPDWAGFWGAVLWAPHENVNDTYTGYGVGYAKGPINLGLSYEENKQRVGGAKVNKSISFGGNYDFKFLRLMANYQTVDDLAISPNGHTGGQLTQLVIGQGPRTITANEQKGYAIGAEIPVGAFLFGVQYTEMDYDGTPSAAGLPSSYNLGKFSVGVKYDLSRRTFLYSSASMATGDLNDYITADKQYQVGIQHRF